MKTAFVIQARMTSSRLPGKILKEILNKPLLEYQVERLRRVKEADGIVIATTINETDLPVVELCKKLDVPYYRGSEIDVLSRYYEAATYFGLNDIIRVTSDCPVIDPGIVSKVIKSYLESKNSIDYASNSLERSYPRGMDTEIFSYEALTRAHLEAREPAHREHVTAYIYANPDKFRLKSIVSSIDNSNFRLTVDTPEDFQLIKVIIEALYPKNHEFGIDEIINFLNEFPEHLKINEHVIQKKL
ncbi:cytidylyltransferase [Leptospira fainei serovar Hurstbridge str. BUT 6]|uniref:Cytidylyltransferase n=1 Tax=Leptospira fainei serovar Hurstbridge str. BUT 6 TaxID=1193011 RepID=S3V5A2_9LEPT|nr:glycosyltransferase family protein [Leptospira fainei]EPG75814.1 cytidylyltransferase [Leptospira fainei serovar Hurstbridge str. BUT 6]